MVSVVITTYNREWNIVKRAVDSVLAQTVRDLELFVVDDNKDGVLSNTIRTNLDLLGRSDVHYLKTNGREGACAARNCGLANSRGEYIAFLDDDDEWYPEKLEKQIKVFTDNDDLGLVYCSYVFFNEDTDRYTVPRKTFKKFRKGNVYNDLLSTNFIGSTSFPLIRKSALTAIGGFDVEMQSCQDYDVWLRIAAKYQVAFVPEILVKYHVHSNESIGKNPEKRLNGQNRLIAKNLDALSKYRGAYYARLSFVIPMYADVGDFATARKKCRELIRAFPFRIVSNVILLIRLEKHVLKKKKDHEKY